VYQRRQSFHCIREGVLAGFPIIIGYLPIAMTFGILAKTAGLSARDAFCFSAFVFAGSSQFMALSLLSIGSGAGEVILTTLLVNFRHFLMSASLATKLEKNIKRWIPFIAFGITDEAFSIVSFRQKDVTKEFILTVEIMGYISWVGGTLLGYLAGGILPPAVQESMGVAIYAMFVTLLIPEAKKSLKIGLLACLSGMVNAILNNVDILSQSWNLILSIVFSSAIGAYLFAEKEVHSYE